MVTTTRRERQRAATSDEIKSIARRQMAEQGAAALSLRAIAAAMGITAPAIYRYFPNRDALVTALIVDAYRALGAAIAAADAAVARDRFGDRFLAAAGAYRDWSISHPAEFQLIFGTPIPGYEAPAAVTVPVVLETFSPFAAIPQEAWHAGALSAATFPLEPTTDERLRGWMGEEGLTFPAPLLRLVLEGWGQMHGLVTLELIGQLPPLVGDAAPLYAAAMRAFVARLGFPSAP